MALVVKDGKEIRVPGRPVEQEFRRKGILGIADAMPLSEFKAMDFQDRMSMLRDALIAKRKFEKSAKCQEALERAHFGTKGIKGELLHAACLKVAELQARLPSYGYPKYWMRNPDEFDMDDMRFAMLHPDLGEGEMPYTARLVQFAALRDGSKGVFTTREIIDAGARGRQFRWRAFVMEKGQQLKEAAEDHAYELERPVFIKIGSDGDRGLALFGLGWEKKI